MSEIRTLSNDFTLPEDALQDYSLYLDYLKNLKKIYIPMCTLKTNILFKTLALEKN